MLEHIADFTAWPILTGIFIGYIANRIMSGEGKGCCMNLFIGIVGSYAGAIISNLLNIELFGKGYLTNFVFCVIGGHSGIVDLEEALRLVFFLLVKNIRL